MAMLTSGEYTLIKKKTVLEEKSMLFVKLTDSALRALDNYLKNIDKCESPVIEFNKDEGRLVIPTFQKDGSEADKLAQFKFNVTSNEIMQGRQGLLECIQHRKGSKQLVKLGQLTRRLRVHANEDVYETTRKRITAIEQEQRKNCTVLLDRNSPQVNRRNRLDRLPKFNSTLPSLPKAASLTAASSQGATAADDSKIVSVPETNMIRNKGRPVTSTLPSKLSAASIIRKPLKDRIIHLLALRPLNKLQVISALDKDGIRKCDKSNISEILSSVATLRDNVYHLSRHAWNDVQEDWYFYTDLEKQQIKRAKSCNLTSPSGSDSGISITSNHSPNPNSTAPSIEKSPSSTYKRPGYFNGVDGFQTKRQRISHFVKPEPSSGSVKPEENAHSRNNACFDELNVAKSAPDRPSKPIVKYSPDSPDISDSKPNSDMVRKPCSIFQYSPDSPHDPTEKAKPIPSVVVTSPQTAPDRNGDSSEPSIDHKPPPPSFYSPPKVPDSLPAPEHKYQKPKYMKDYVTIRTMEQRRRYKSDFNTIFKEYKRVHEEIDSISNTFAQLGESLRQHKKGTPKYAKIEQEILQKYHDIKSSKKFQAAKLRFEYLHEKLSHIKNLVHEYDEKILNH